jgi:hypothetical protein
MSYEQERARLWAQLQKAIHEDLLLKAQIESLMAQIDHLDAEEESKRRAKALFHPPEPEPGEFRPSPSGPAPSWPVQPPRNPGDEASEDQSST